MEGWVCLTADVSSKGLERQGGRAFVISICESLKMFFSKCVCPFEFLATSVCDHAGTWFRRTSNLRIDKVDVLPPGSTQNTINTRLFCDGGGTRALQAKVLQVIGCVGARLRSGALRISDARSAWMRQFLSLIEQRHRKAKTRLSDRRTLLY